MYGYRWNRVCWVDDRFIGENLQRYCGWTRQRVVVGTETVYTNASKAAREFAAQFNLVDGRIDPGVTPGSAAARNIDRILADALGADVLNGRLERACNGFFIYDSGSSIACNDGFSLGRILMQTATEFREDAVPDTAADRRRKLTPAEKTMARDSGLGLSEEELDTIELVNAGSVIARFPEAACVVSSSDPHVISCTDSYYQAVPAGLMLHELVHVAQNLYPLSWPGSSPADWQLDENGDVAMERRYTYRDPQSANGRLDFEAHGAYVKSIYESIDGVGGVGGIKGIPADTGGCVWETRNEARFIFRVGSYR